MTIENTDAYNKWLRNVQQYGLTLRSVPETLKTEALCLAAVQQDGTALQYVPKALKTEALCLAAVQQSGVGLQHVPEVLKTEALCLAAVQQRGVGLQHVPEVLKTEALCFAAVQKHGTALEYVIRPTDQLAADAEQLASWNRILMQVDKTGLTSKEHLQAQLISPLLKQVNKAPQLPAPVVDEIATLIEHCERLRINIEPVKELYCEKQPLRKLQSKHRLTDSAEFSL